MAYSNYLSLIKAVKLESGIDLDFSYCRITGKPIAVNLSKMMVDVFNLLNPADADECQRDDYLVRMLIASRTSPCWSIVTKSTIAEQFRLDRPSVLTYLFARLIKPKVHDQLKTTTSELISDISNRIKLHSFFSSITNEEVNEKLKFICFLLLDIDSRSGLTKINNPTTFIRVDQLFDFINRPDSLDFFKSSLESFLTKATLAQVKQFREARWHAGKGNTLTQQAFAENLILRAPKADATPEKIKQYNLKMLATKLFEEMEKSGDIQHEKFDRNITITSPAPKRPIAGSKPKFPTKEPKKSVRFGGFNLKK